MFQRRFYKNQAGSKLNRKIVAHRFGFSNGCRRIGNAAPQIRKIWHVQGIARGGQTRNGFAKASQRVAAASTEARPCIFASGQDRTERVNCRLQRDDIDFSRNSLWHQYFKLVQCLHAVHQRVPGLRTCYMVENLSPQAICHTSRAFYESSYLQIDASHQLLQRSRRLELATVRGF